MLLPSQSTPFRQEQGHLRGTLSETQVAIWLAAHGAASPFHSVLYQPHIKAGQSKHRNFFPKCLCSIHVHLANWWTGLPQITPWDKTSFPSKTPAGNQMGECLLVEPVSMSRELYLGVGVYFPSNS